MKLILSMSVLYLQNLGDTIYKNLIKIFNKRFNLNSTTLDDMLNYLDSNDYELVVKYKNVHNFLFHNEYLFVFKTIRESHLIWHRSLCK